MRRNALLAMLSGVFALAMIQPALAHPGHVGHDFGSGWWHPMMGWDHLLAMVAVGLLAVRLGGRAVWLLPMTFLGSMMAGGMMAGAGLPMVGVEAGTAASVLVFGLLIAATWRVDLRVGTASVAMFAALHGYAHMAEVASGASLSAYAGGFLLATAALHVCGIAIGLAIVRMANRDAVRWTGGAVAMASLVLMLGSL